MWLQMGGLYILLKIIWSLCSDKCWKGTCVCVTICVWVANKNSKRQKLSVYSTIKYLCTSCRWKKFFEQNYITFSFEFKILKIIINWKSSVFPALFLLWERGGLFPTSFKATHYTHGVVFTECSLLGRTATILNFLHLYTVCPFVDSDPKATKIPREKCVFSECILAVVAWLVAAVKWNCLQRGLLSARPKTSLWLLWLLVDCCGRL